MLRVDQSAVPDGLHPRLLKKVGEEIAERHNIPIFPGYRGGAGGLESFM